MEHPIDRVDKYTLVNGESQSALVSTVNMYMMRGWQPEGAPFAITDEEGKGSLIQAMVHREGDDGRYLQPRF